MNIKTLVVALLVVGVMVDKVLKMVVEEVIVKMAVEVMVLW